MPKDYKCPTCRDTGWAYNTEHNAVSRCNCFLSGQHERLLAAAGIPERYQNCTIANYNSFHNSQSRAKHFVTEFIDTFPYVEHGLFLLGPCGVGKTHLAVALLMELIREKRVKGIYLDIRDMLNRILASYNSGGQESEQAFLAKLCSYDLIVLDELGAQKITAWNQEKVSYIINLLYNRNKPLILTSNYPLKTTGKNAADSLEDRVGTRMLSRLHELCKFVQINGDDLRLNKFS